MAGFSAKRAAKDKSTTQNQTRSQNSSRQTNEHGPEADMMFLQSTVGNRAFGQMLQNRNVNSRSGDAIIQRKCSCGGTCAQCQEKDEQHLQRKESGGSTLPLQANGIPQVVQSVLERRDGYTLDPQIRSDMKAHFKQDFGQVRIHTDTTAHRAAASINAAAFTVGNSIWFGQGQYQPYTDRGRYLLAHELAHTIQQHGQISSPQRSLLIGSVNDPAEAAADSAASAVLRNGVVPVLGTAKPMLRRRQPSFDPHQPIGLADYERLVPIVTGTENPNVVNVTYEGNTYRVRRRITGQRVVRETRETSDSARLRADFDRSNAWVQVEWCSAGGSSTRGRVRLGANIPDALQQTIRDIVFSGQDPRTALRSLDLTPFLEVDIARSEQFRVRARADTTIQPSTGNIQRGGGSLGLELPGATLEFNIGVTPGQGPQGQTGVDVGIGVRVEFGDRPEPVRCTETTIERYIPEYALECVQQIPPRQVPQNQSRFLYFEYATGIIATQNSSTGRSRRAENNRAASQNDQEIPRIQQLINEGWQVSAIRGYTSPEGPRGQGEGGFIGNQSLSELRATAAQRYIEGLCNPSGAIRPRTCFTPNAPISGEGELLTADEPTTGRELEGAPLATQATPRFLGSEGEASRWTPQLEQQLTTATPRQQASLIYPLLRRVAIDFTKEVTTPAREQNLETCPPAVEREARGYFDNQQRR